MELGVNRPGACPVLFAKTSRIWSRRPVNVARVDRVAGATYETVSVPDGTDWRERVTVIADANWASCQAHPWITDLAFGRPVPGPGASAKYETELRALDGIGLSDIDMEHTLTALLSLVQGTARAALAARRSRASGEDPDTDWWSRIEPALSATIGEPNRYPTASRVSRALGERTGRPTTRKAPTVAASDCSSTASLSRSGTGTEP